MKPKLIICAATILIAVCLSVSFYAATTPANPAWAGTWNTTWKSTDGRDVSGVVLIKFEPGSAKDLDGTVEAKGANGVMYGSLSTDGKTWSGDWFFANVGKGTFTFTLKANNKFEGTYTQTGVAGNFVWNGTK